MGIIALMQRLEGRSTADDPPQTLPGVSGRNAWVAQAGVAGALALVAMLISLVYWPGLLDSDTVGEMQEAATGKFSDWHTPVLEALWRIPILLGLRGTGPILLVGVFTLLLGFYLVLRVRFSRLVSTVIAVLCCMWPPVLTWGVHVGDDAWFAAAILASFGFTARMARTEGRARTVSLVSAVWFAFIASAARHNAIPAVLVLFFVMAGLTTPSHVRRRRIVVGATAVLATASLLLVQYGLQTAIGTVSRHPLQSTYEYDLAQLSKQEHRVLFPRAVDPGQSLSAIEKNTTVYNIDFLTYTSRAVIHFPVEGSRFAALQKAWEHAAENDPTGYLQERGRLGLWMLSIGHPSYWLYDPHSAQYPPKFVALNNVGYSYLKAMTHGPYHEFGDFPYDGWIYALIVVAGAVVFCRRARLERPVAGLCIGILFYTVVLEFSGPGEEYRYIYPMVATGTVVAALLLAVVADSIRSGRSQSRSSPERNPTTDSATPSYVQVGDEGWT